jgi:hypothetical protein
MNSFELSYVALKVLVELLTSWRKEVSARLVSAE